MHHEEADRKPDEGSYGGSEDQRIPSPYQALNTSNLPHLV
ncbi:hypothetical protein TIFTF001_004523 [Ficus carica]|uniref:Uncharacterized protein n=1 Tax=Ficus carica TaxID=3494 RepID=A0AA87ZD96_FICCA|nr:hypothetical protein TIFTF001_004523 [Ficus carica]